eukprot:890900-Pleurochrysis_carterae.AAC.1
MPSHITMDIEVGSSLKNFVQTPRGCESAGEGQWERGKGQVQGRGRSSKHVARAVLGRERRQKRGDETGRERARVFTRAVGWS